MLEPIEDLEAWFVARSSGWPALERFADRADVSEAEATLVRDYQLGAFAGDVAAHRDGEPARDGLTRLLGLAARARDGERMEVYRGLSLAQTPAPGEAVCETSLSSWSLYPSVALRAALAHAPRERLVVLRARLAEGEAAAYLDEWEFELMRPPFRAQALACYSDRVTMLGFDLEVDVVDLGLGGPPDA